MRRYASQARTNVLRSTSISPLIVRKQRKTLLPSNNIVHRPSLQPQVNSSDIRSNQIIEKKNSERQNQQSRSTIIETNNKSQMVAFKSIIQPTQKQLISNTPSTARSTLFTFPKVRKKDFCFLFFQIKISFSFLGISIK
jgi:hypothetical protein